MSGFTTKFGVLVGPCTSGLTTIGGVGALMSGLKTIGEVGGVDGGAGGVTGGVETVPPDTGGDTTGAVVVPGELEVLLVELGTGGNTGTGTAAGFVA